jgi:cell shape-determining protein MreC
VEQSCSSSPSRFNRLKIQSWTTSLAHDLVRESGWGVYKRRKKLTQRERKSRENRAKKNQSKEIIHREKERKEIQHT